ncbi:hypothetical protein BJ138DRAFT_1014627, partial [Hygrophoropsis aurantiaca]
MAAEATAALQQADSIDSVVSIVQIWDPLLQKIKFVTDILNNIAEIHPYVKMAWSILSFIPKTIIAQVDRCDAICTLLQSLHDMYQCITDVESLTWNDEVVREMTFQTIECARFIRDYAQQPSFRKQLAKGIFQDTDGQIKSYNAKIQHLKETLQRKTIFKSGICVMHILEKVDDLASAVDLNDMPYAHGAKYQREKMCLPGTRKDMIDEICAWINDQGDDVPRAIFLTGVAGSGKSAIAHTVSHIFDNLQRLGSSFFFDHSKAAIFYPGVLFSTITRDLADVDPAFAIKLVQAIEKRADRSTLSLVEQFEKFITKPTCQLQIVGPILIVIDGLDESGDNIQRKQLLSVLARKISTLPSNFRVLITGRPEHDITRVLYPSKNFVVKEMSTVCGSEVLYADISQFVENHLKDARENLDLKWPNNEWVNIITTKAKGLFQWAFTACEFIINCKAGQTPDSQLEIILQAPNSRVFGELDDLYMKILEHSLAIDDKASIEKFKGVMGIILTAMEPLPVSILQKLQPNINVKSVVLFLGSVLTGVTTDTDPVQPLHISFRDFLVNQKQSGQLYIDIAIYQEFIGLNCLRIMKYKLKFNICELESSYVFNKNISDLPKRIEKYISKDLSYACKYWIDHLASTSNKVVNVNNYIQDFLGGKLLWWLEVMILLGDSQSIMDVLLKLHQWTSDTMIQILADDAIQFVDVLGEAFIQSLPHLYLSALSWAPVHSCVRKNYISQYCSVLQVQQGQLISWPSLRKTIKSSSQQVAVAFSSNGKQVVSGSHDGTICIWDVYTGNPVIEPLTGHTGYVTSVAFSPDDKQVVSGSHDGTICIWDTHTGSLMIDPLTGHTGQVTSVAFSPDGKQVVSGSHDRTICIWDAHTGSLVVDPLTGHTGQVTSVAFSPDGTQVVSGSADNTICIWDPLIGHIDMITSVAFSPDGKQVVSGSYDDTICIWDALTGSPVMGPLIGHTDWVTSVAFSPDGKNIVSASYDNTICIWDVNTGSLVMDPLTGHTDRVTSVVFSPDSKQVVSGSTDKTICIWDVHTGSLVIEPLAGHTDWVNSVAFSPDSKQIVSGSNDNTIRIWDTYT